MSQTAIHADLETEFAAAAASSGCELVHVEFRGDRLRVFLDRPEGVTLDDCTAVSREISARLDLHEFGKQRYLLEVSSPGLDRRLYGPRDYERFRGRLVRVTHVAGGAKQTVVGRLRNFRPEPPRASANGSEDPGRHPAGGEISVLDEATGKRHEISLNDIRVARLEIEF